MNWDSRALCARGRSSRPEPRRPALPSALSWPLLLLWLAAAQGRFGAIFVGSIVALSILGALAARAGGAGMLKGALRVCLWSAVAMAVTMLIGSRIRWGHMSGRVERRFRRARRWRAKLALQALYRWQLNACPWQDLVQEFAADAGHAASRRGVFPRAGRQAYATTRETLDAALAPLLDRTPPLLDPIEHARAADRRRTSCSIGRRCRSASSSTRPSASRGASAPPTATSSSTPCSIARARLWRADEH